MRFEDLTPAEQAEVLADRRACRRMWLGVALGLLAGAVLIGAAVVGRVGLDDTRSAHSTPSPPATASVSTNGDADVVTWLASRPGQGFVLVVLLASVLVPIATLAIRSRPSQIAGRWDIHRLRERHRPRPPGP